MASTVIGIGDKTFEGTAFIALEDTEGKATGMYSAEATIRARWHYGTLLEVDGEPWFCGWEGPCPIEDPHSGERAQAPVLVKVGPSYIDRLGEDPVDLMARLPVEGEFWLSREDEPNIVAVPWWDDYEGPFEADTVAIQRIEERVRDLTAETAPSL